VELASGVFEFLLDNQLNCANHNFFYDSFHRQNGDERRREKMMRLKIWDFQCSSSLLEIEHRRIYLYINEYILKFRHRFSHTSQFFFSSFAFLRKKKKEDDVDSLSVLWIICERSIQLEIFPCVYAQFFFHSFFFHSFPCMYLYLYVYDI
jgi:hypothetical protein